MNAGLHESELFSIDLGGRSAKELLLHEQLTVYFDAIRVFNLSKEGASKSKVKHTHFFTETGITYNYFLTYARDHSDMIDHPSYNAGPLHYNIAEAAITPLGAKHITDAVSSREKVAIHLARLPAIIDMAIQYLQSR